MNNIPNNNISNNNKPWIEDIDLGEQQEQNCNFGQQINFIPQPKKNRPSIYYNSPKQIQENNYFPPSSEKQIQPVKNNNNYNYNNLLNNVVKIDVAKFIDHFDKKDTKLQKTYIDLLSYIEQENTLTKNNICKIITKPVLLKYFLLTKVVQEGTTLN